MCARVRRLLSSIMSRTESQMDREEDYRFLHSVLMEKKLHLLFKVMTPHVCSFFSPTNISVGNNCAIIRSDLTGNCSDLQLLLVYKCSGSSQAVP